MVYGATAVTCGAVFVALALQLARSSETDRRAAHRLFVFSIFYLFLLFAALLVDHRGGQASSISSWHADQAGIASVRPDLLPCLTPTASRSTAADAHEV
jgi:protoheme IX farnesyltransferase